MAWTVFADWLATGEMATKYAHFKPSENNLILTIRSWLIFYNNPTFTNLGMKIYSDSGGTSLLYTSATKTKAEILTDINAAKEVSFVFNAPGGVPVKSGIDYYAFLFAAGYVGTTGSHIAWKKAFPDPKYPTGLTIQTKNLDIWPNDVSFFGTEGV